MVARMMTAAMIHFFICFVPEPCERSGPSGRKRGEDGAQALRFAAERAAGAGHVVPREDVEVRPCDVRGHEVVEEERRDDGAGEPAAPGIVDVDDVAVEEA